MPQPTSRSLPASSPRSASSASSETISPPSTKPSSPSAASILVASSTRSGKTFHWGGEYGENVNEAQTNFTDLNVFENFEPKIPAAYDDSEILFLANIQPELQLDVRRKMPRVALVGGDTMNLWINIKRAEFLDTLKRSIFFSSTTAKPNSSAERTALCSPPRRFSPSAPSRWSSSMVSTAPPSSSPMARTRSAPRLCPSPRSRPHRRRRHLCWRLHGLHRSQPELTPDRPQARHVLRRSHGLVYRRALRSRASALADARGNRRTFPALPQPHPS